MALNLYSPFEIETKTFGGRSQFLDISLPDRRRIMMKVIGRYDHREFPRLSESLLRCKMLYKGGLRWPNWN